MLTAVMIDSREPTWVQELVLDGIEPIVTLLDEGDALLACDDDRLLCVERKTPDDLLSSISDNRLMLQAAALTKKTPWAYVVVTGMLQCNHTGHVVTERGETGWSYAALQGALLTVQELGVFVISCENDQAYGRCLSGLARRNRESVPLWPARPPKYLSAGEAMLASLPGIGLERMRVVLEQLGSPAHALTWLTGDLDVRINGIGPATKTGIRRALGLEEHESLMVISDQKPTFTGGTNG